MIMTDLWGVKCVTKDLDNLVTNMTFNEYE